LGVESVIDPANRCQLKCLRSAGAVSAHGRASALLICILARKLRKPNRSFILSVVEIRPVRTRREKNLFLNLPWKIYRDWPAWVPPLRLSQKELVGYRSHPFYEQAEIATFLAFCDGEPCGRIAAIDNHVHNQLYPDEKRGFVGFFESENDQQVANALFDAAREWLGTHGLHDLRGPTNPSINYEWGLLTDAFDLSPTFLMTYNPPYYVQLWEEYGFEKVQELYTYYGQKHELSLIKDKVHFIVREASERFGIRLRPLDKRNFKAEVRTFLGIYNTALVGTWGYIPLSKNEIKHFSNSLRYLIVPELTILAEIDDKIVGCMFGLLDYNPRIKKIDGRLFPFGFLQLLTRRREFKRLRLVSTNVLPEYQRWGVGAVLAVNLIEPGLAWGGIEEAEFSWVLESNTLSRQTLEKGGLTREKTHRIYDWLST
jgi:GNAT superfamily N-acetyltransferase